MIEEVRLINFQSHKNTTVKLDKGINAFIGSSTAGKTSVLRAINWALTNRPSGNVYVNYGNRDKKGNPIGETSAEIEFNNHTVKRIKTKDLNGYEVDGQQLGCVGTDVPELVTQAFNMDSLNVHKQLEPHFMLSESAGEVARYLNSLIGLSLIDGLLSKADQSQRATNKDIGACKDAISSFKEELSSLAYLDEATALLKDYDLLDTTIGNLTGEVMVITEATTKYKAISSSIESLKDILKDAKKLVSDFESADVALKKLLDTTDNVECYIADAKRYAVICALRKTLNDATPLLNSFKSLTTQIDTIVPSRATLMGIMADYVKYVNILKTKEVLETAKDFTERYTYYDGKYVTNCKAFDDLTSLVGKAVNTSFNLVTLKEQLRVAKESMPKVCPTCGSPLKGGKNDSCK